ncbi:serine/threonine-protein kinase [Streptomyces sp. TRM64462]|uniref:serine/threonine-protein kinase n=1 Tax=Streptomyces sp. TRM64462 TaxID=2741726 RepID=UPI001586C504|nr:serine/threonine-protein kinase [Streptomyces sp. TRM64462]
MPTGEASGGELIGKVLGGRYRVTSVVGRGGMGVVARAVDELLNREVAVKVLRAFTDASAAELADLRARMQREAQAAARIRHSGVVTVHDVTEEQGLPVIVMELVDGPSLDDLLMERGTLEPYEAAAIGAKLMDALDAAHRAGVLHRDVKPANVLLEHGGRVVLTDFGIATMEASGDDAMAKLTRSGDIIGSVDYLPPERAQGREPGPASDIWSLGMTLYAAVEGTSPFRRNSAWSTLSAIVTEPLPEPRRAGPLTPVLQALMAKVPEDRPTADQARGLLERVASGGTVRLASPAQAYAATPTVASAAPPPGFGAPLFPQPTPQPQPPHAGYPQPGLPQMYPQPGAPTAATVGVPGPPTSRTAARRARRRNSRTLLATAAALVLLAAGGGITYALTAQQGGTTTAQQGGTAVDGVRATAPAISSPPGTHQPTGDSTPSSAVSPDASSKEPEGHGAEEEEPAPTKKPGTEGDKPAESPSASEEPQPSPTVKEPTPVSTACTGWAHENNSDGYGYLAETSHLYTGPYAACQYVTAVKTGVKIFYHCYITNAYGNKWIYARIEGTNTEGWASSTKLTRESGNLARC